MGHNSRVLSTCTRLLGQVFFALQKSVARGNSRCRPSELLLGWCAHCIGSPMLSKQLSTLRIEHVDKRLGAASRIVVRLSLRINHELARRIWEFSALGIVGAIHTQ